MGTPPGPARIPPLLHVVNVVGLCALWAVFGLSFIVHPVRDPAFVAAGLAVSLGTYRVLHRRLRAVEACLFLIQVLVVYVAAAQSLLTLERVFGFNVSRDLGLSARLQKRAAAGLAAGRYNFMESVGGDPLFYRRTPGSTHRYRYDHTRANALYAVAVDESGYLNLNRGFYASSPQIDAFVSGDSVLQGTGMPSALEAVKKTVPFSLWNLSTGSYGPRAKVRALMTYALPKRPKLVVVEFFAGNDASDMNEDEALAGSGTFEDRFAHADLTYRMLTSRTYGPLLVGPGWNYLWRLRADNLTLALSYYVVRQLKQSLGAAYRRGKPDAVHVLAEAGTGPGAAPRLFAMPAYANFAVRPEAYGEWIRLGLEGTFREYRLLLAAVSRMQTPAKVAVLYNPTSYEIYRGLAVAPNPEQDARVEQQRRAVAEFCRSNGVEFLDLLPGLRRAVEGKPPVWLYGAIDPIHWSESGTEAAAAVIRDNLLRAYPGPGARRR